MTDEPRRAPRPRILVIDDTPHDLALLRTTLRARYRVLIRDLRQAPAVVASDSADLILLAATPAGLELCRQLMADPATGDIPIILLGGPDARENEQHGLRLGAADYLGQPVSPPALLARIESQLARKAETAALRDRSASLEAEVAQRTRELLAGQDVTLLVLTALVETRDQETGNHILRTQHYIRLLADALRDHPRFREYLDEPTIEALSKSAPLHDIGKVGIPDSILRKPGRLTDEEFEVMKRHPLLGREAIEQVERWLGQPVAFLRHVKESVYSHHEKWDGSGYPEGLAGDAIPIAARLMALADVYDALTSHRAYKAGIPHAQAVRIIRDGRGSHFDPAVADAFCAQEERFQAVARHLADNVDPAQLLAR